MRKWVKAALIVFLVIFVLLTALALVATRTIANDIIHDPVKDRDPITKTPASFGLPFETVAVNTADGTNLTGWYLPSSNRAAVILQHGFEENRQNLLEEAAMLNIHGYGVLLSTVRGHDQNGEQMITFGCQEVEDLDSWYIYLLSREDVDPGRIGILGQSMGGSLAIQYAHQNEEIRAVAAHSPLTSLADTVDIGLRRFSPIPDPLIPILKPLVIFWGEKLTSCDLVDIDASKWIGAISPRPTFLICGGRDELVIEENCRSLLAEAEDPISFWFEESCAHHDCDTLFPEEFERRLLDFFNSALLAAE